MLYFINIQPYPQALELSHSTGPGTCSAFPCAVQRGQGSGVLAQLGNGWLGRLPGAGHLRCGPILLSDLQHGLLYLLPAMVMKCFCTAARQ